ncbi:hypothetical protein C8Q72DRAFT_936881 [Fomitopsis betulina]|nr:hypothetical protein C8Q72DRAFT_936881 [Fomitopsis betulina]
MAAQNELTPAGLAIHTPDGTVWTQWDADLSRHVVSCDICGKQIVLMKHGHSHAFFEHRRSRTCLEQQRKVEHQRVCEAAAVTRRELFDVQNNPQNLGAVAEIVGFRRKTDDDTLWILSINLEELEDKAASLTVTVQLLDMFTRDASTVAAERCTWQWNHSYI